MFKCLISYSYLIGIYIVSSSKKIVGNGNGNGNTLGSIMVGDSKGKRKGLPAKNLMAERRRRKKLNDRLYMLRSVVPKISKVRSKIIDNLSIAYLKCVMFLLMLLKCLKL